MTIKIFQKITYFDDILMEPEALDKEVNSLEDEVEVFSFTHEIIDTKFSTVATDRYLVNSVMVLYK